MSNKFNLELDDTVKIEMLVHDHCASIPRYAYKGDAGLDLTSAMNSSLKPFERTLISTGISLAIPNGYCGLILPRSGLAIKKGLTLINAPGLIDSEYRGEIKVALLNLDSKNTIHIEKGDRIAQLLIQKVPFVDLINVNELPETERGERGFGSSGVSNKE